MPPFLISSCFQYCARHKPQAPPRWSLPIFSPRSDPPAQSLAHLLREAELKVCPCRLRSVRAWSEACCFVFVTEPLCCGLRAGPVCRGR